MALVRAPTHAMFDRVRFFKSAQHLLWEEKLNTSIRHIGAPFAATTLLPPDAVVLVTAASPDVVLLVWPLARSSPCTYMPCTWTNVRAHTHNPRTRTLSDCSLIPCQYPLRHFRYRCCSNHLYPPHTMQHVSYRAQDVLSWPGPIFAHTNANCSFWVSNVCIFHRQEASHSERGVVYIQHNCCCT